MGTGSMTVLSTGGVFQCSEPVGTTPGSLGPIHSCHQSALLCHFCSHLSAPAAACRLQGTTRPGGPARPYVPHPHHLSLRLWALRCGIPAASPNPDSTPLSSSQGFSASRGLLTKAWGPGTGLTPCSHSRAPALLPLRRLIPHPAAALPLFHQAKDCFLNKSKKLHFLLGKFILSHFIFPPIFFPNNVIK